MIHLDEGFLGDGIDLLPATGERFVKALDDLVVVTSALASRKFVQSKQVVKVLLELALFDLGQTHALDFAQSARAVLLNFLAQIFYLQVDFLDNIGRLSSLHFFSKEDLVVQDQLIGVFLVNPVSERIVALFFRLRTWRDLLQFPC